MSKDEKTTEKTEEVAQVAAEAKPKKPAKKSKKAAKSEVVEGGDSTAESESTDSGAVEASGGEDGDGGSVESENSGSEKGEPEEEVSDEVKESRASSNKEFKISQILIKEFASFAKVEVYSKDLRNVYRRYKVHFIFNDKKFQQRFDRLNEQSEQLAQNPELPLGSKKFESRQRQIDRQWADVTKELEAARAKYPSISFDVVTDGVDFTSSGIKFDWELKRETIEFLISRGLGDCNQNYILTLRAEK